MKKQIFLYLIITAAFFACSKSSDKKAELEALKKEQASLKEKITKLEAELSVQDTTGGKQKLVGVTEMQQSTFNHFIEVQARVEGDEDVMLSPEAAGTITSLNVKAGDRVSAGQILATIDDKLVRQGMSELQSQLDLATQVYNRQKNLWDQKIGSEIQFLQAKTNKEALERRMGSIREQLSMTRIKSPINGTVDDVRIKVGQTVAPGMQAIRVVNLTSLKVRGEVAESFINRVKSGNEAILYFPDQQKEIKTKIDYSGNRIDPVNRTFNVEVRLKDKSLDVRPNMIAVLKIIDYSKPDALVLPVAAVQKSSDGEFVYVAEKQNGKLIAKRKIVKSGTIYNGQTEIISGLTVGDKVITNGYQTVIEGDAIQL
jgi:membrane fusion protein, multidrug efflux system